MHISGDFYHETEAEYQHNYTTHKSATSLKRFHNSPLLYRYEQLGLLPSKRGEFFTFGSAFHCYVLEPQAFFQRYQIADPPVNPKTCKPYGSSTKAAQEWRDSLGGNQVVTREEFETIQSMATAIKLQHPGDQRDIQDAQRELSWRGQLGPISFQSRIDALADDCVVDLKTTRNLDDFESQIVEYNYPYQLGCYTLVAGVKRAKLVAIEKQQPYRVGVWFISRSKLDQVHGEIERDLEDLNECLESDVWPSGYELVRQITN
jgi:exodeoxyribonuclease VIII